MRRLVSVLALGLLVGLLVGVAMPSSAGPSATLRRLANRIAALESRMNAVYTETEANARFLHHTTLVRESDSVFTFDEHTVTCPPGQQALAGGVDFPFAEEAAEADAQVAESGPVVGQGDANFASGWHVGVYNYGPGSETYSTYAVCAEPATF